LKDLDNQQFEGEEDRYLFPLDVLSADTVYKKNNSTAVYEDIKNYLAAVLNLYSNMCKGRNMDVLKKLKKIGLTEKHIFATL
jgi:hypothetical protein